MLRAASVVALAAVVLAVEELEVAVEELEVVLAVLAEQVEAGGTSSFKYVYIAADESKPYEVRMRWHPHPVRRALTDPLDRRRWWRRRRRAGVTS